MSDHHHHQQTSQQSQQLSQSQQQAQQQQAQQAQQQQQMLSIKVMRLGKPVLQLNNDGKFLLKPEVEGSCVQESDTLFKESLKIPSAFGSITAGEVLKCCICVTNSSPIDINNVILRVEINKYTNASATQLVYKNVLLDTISQPVATLTFGGKINHIVQHKVIDSGYHHIVCSVRYTRHMPSTPAGSVAAAGGGGGGGGTAAAVAAAVSGAGGAAPTQQMTLRKSYGFNVGQPMNVQARIHYLYPKEGHKWLVEVQAIAKVPVFLEGFSMEPCDSCTCTPLTPLADGGSGIGEDSDGFPQPQPLQAGGKSRFPAHLPRFKPLEKYFGPESVIHRVFEVALKPNTPVPQKLGTININWNGPFGSANKMSTSIVLPPEKAHSTKSATPITLVGIAPESPSVPLYTPFTLRCTFSNMGDEPIRATVSFTEGIASNTGISLADHITQGDPILFEPKKEVTTTFNLVALCPGLQSIGRLTLTDLGNGKKMIFKDLGSIVVL